VSGGQPSGREGQHRPRLVQGDKAFDVARVGPLKEEPAEVLRLRSWFGFCASGHVQDHLTGA